MAYWWSRRFGTLWDLAGVRQRRTVLSYILRDLTPEVLEAVLRKWAELKEDLVAQFRPGRSSLQRMDGPAAA